MIKTEKVIKGLECCAAMSGDECKECPYSKECLDENLPYGMPHLAADALALLKAQEPIEARLHLCESCTKEYPECDAKMEGIEFGSGNGNDNIIGCTTYVNRWKSQNTESVDAPKPDSDIGCWYNITHNYTLEQVVSALKVREPHIMTINEWREWKQKPLSQRDPVYYVDNKGFGSWINPNDQLFIYATPELGYGILFVCWTSRPTEEQREATPWNAQK